MTHIYRGSELAYTCCFIVLIVCGRGVWRAGMCLGVLRIDKSILTVSIINHYCCCVACCVDPALFNYTVSSSRLVALKIRPEGLLRDVLWQALHDHADRSPNLDKIYLMAVHLTPRRLVLAASGIYRYCTLHYITVNQTLYR